MKTFPDFTWEWIIQGCEYSVNAIHESGETKKYKNQLQRAEGIRNVTLELRTHPQLEKLVPMMSLMCLWWFPAENFQIILEYIKGKYVILLCGTHPLTKLPTSEKKEVAFDQVANEVYALIQKYRDDA